MASAFTQMLAGDKLEVFSAGTRPADKLNPLMVQVMQEKGIDMGFRQTTSLKSILDTERPELVISMGKEDAIALPDDMSQEFWQFSEPDDLDAMRQLRDAVEARVTEFIREMA
jgi:protein-tyrosine-phosphatase